MSVRAWTRSAISFPSGGQTCSGELYLPESQGRFPCVVLANGFSGTMDWILPDIAAKFAEAGIAALAFDYRHLGRSEGEPRQIIDVRRQREDLANAVACARTHAAVDPHRIALWGTSLGGSHVIAHAAADNRIAAVVANMPGLDVFRGGNIKAKLEKQSASKTQLVTMALKLIGLALLDRAGSLVGLPPRYIRVYGPAGKAIFTDPALADRFRSVERSSPTWRNEVAPRFLLQVPRYRKGTIARIKAPILFSLASRDVEVSADFIREVAKESPVAKVQEYEADHFDLYHGELFEQVARDQVGFLKQHLYPAPSGASQSPA